MRIEREPVDDEIPTSSMADIAFLLIIYFMVTTTFAATRGLDFALPEEDDNQQVVEKEESILIEINPNGDVFVDSTPVQVSGIIDHIRETLTVNPKKPVIIRPDPASPYRYMVEVLDELRQGTDKGLKEEIRISIPTQREIESFWY